MQKLIAHRLYTEDVNRESIVQILNKYFPLNGYTLIPSIGYWNGAGEQSLIIEMIGASHIAVASVADDIKEVNNQEVILHTWQEIRTELR
jgi:hypothetical protein